MTTAPILMAVVALATAEAKTRPWRDDPLFRRLAERLDRVRSIDNHTHLIEGGTFNPALDGMMPLGLRSTQRRRARLPRRAGAPAHRAGARARPAGHGHRARVARQ